VKSTVKPTVQPDTLERLEEITRRLKKRYKRRAPKRTESTTDPLDGLIETILSQQNVDVVTHRMFLALKRSFPSWKHALEAGPHLIQAVLEESRGGLSRIKANYIHRLLVRLMESRNELSLEFLRDLPDLEVRTLLEALPGVGTKSASCVLMFDLGRAAMPVDTHIHRIACRLRFVPDQTDAVQTEAWFDAALPKHWKQRWEFHVNTIDHGRQTCRSQRPRCHECVLADLCPSAVSWEPEIRHGT
jgi:endonuclease-3